MKAIATKNTFNAKESLKIQGFVYDSSTKTWSKDFASQAEFDEFYSNFTSASYSGRRQAKYNAEVVFEFVDVENEPETSEMKNKNSSKIVVPTIEEAVELVHTGKIYNFDFTLNGWNATLNGFAYVIDGKTYNIRELRKISPEADKEADKVEKIIAKQYVSYIKSK